MERVSSSSAEPNVRVLSNGSTPLLFVHGMSANTYWWDDAAAHLPSFHAAALDLSGHGDSPWAADGRYDTELWVSDIEKARRKMGWDRFLLCAHSLGARIALEYARLHSDTLSGLIAFDFLPAFGDAKGSRFARPRTVPQPVYPTEEDILGRFRLQPEGTNLSAEKVRELGRRCIKKSESGWTWKYDWRAFLYTYYPVWPVLQDVTLPTLVVRGEFSTVMTAADLDRILKGLPRGEGVVIPGAHHHVPLDAPAETARLIEDFASVHA